MRKILRSLAWTDSAEMKTQSDNFGFVNKERLTNMRKAEELVLDYILDFYQNQGEPPSFNSVYDYFEKQNATQEVIIVEEAMGEQLYLSASFKDLFEKEVEEQSSQRLRDVCKTASEIATVGKLFGKVKLEGTDEAVAYLFSEAKVTPSGSDDKLSSNMSDNAKALTDIYQERKSNPTKAYGIATGYGFIDSSTSGLKKTQLFLLAGYGGHLKSTLMMNIMLNSSVDGGWNNALFTSEMPAVEVQQLLIAMHSANPKFAAAGQPLNSHKYLLGALSDIEEAFMEEVKDDLLNNPNHGSIRVVDSADFTTFGSIQQKSIQFHIEEELDMLWIDYITRLPLDAKYRGMDTVTGRNETIADAKRFAMSFAQGEGLAVCSPFQVNREGYKKAKANEGKMDTTALAQYNAAEKEADVASYIFYDEEEAATSEPKCGMLKSRWSSMSFDPISLFIDPDSRRISDLSAGMSISTGFAPTQGGAAEDEVEL